MDIVTYEDASIITSKNFYLNANDAFEGDHPSQLERFALSLNTGKITSEVLLSESSEFPRVNEIFHGQPYYLYLAAFDSNIHSERGLSEGEGLYKVNTTTKETLKWVEKGCSAGEPVFVAAPSAIREDEGVVLAVILDHAHHDSLSLSSCF